jgi:hypothetical protein
LDPSYQGNYSLAEAKAWCKKETLCTGFTFETNKTHHPNTHHIRTGEVLKVYFKSANVLNEDASWQAYLKYDPTQAANLDGWHVGEKAGDTKGTILLL